MVSALPLVCLLVGLPIGGAIVFLLLRQRLLLATDSGSAFQAELSQIKEQRAVFEERARQAELLRGDLALRDQKIDIINQEVASFREEKARLETQMTEE